MVLPDTDGAPRASVGECPSSISVRLDIAGLFASSEASGEKPSNSGRTDIEDGLGHSVTTDDGLPSPPVAKLSSTTTLSASTGTRKVHAMGGWDMSQDFWLSSFSLWGFRSSPMRSMLP